MVSLSNYDRGIATPSASSCLSSALPSSRETSPPSTSRAPGALPCPKFLCEDQSHRAALARVARDLSPLMRGNACFQLVSVAHIIGAVCAAENVNEEAHSALILRLPQDSLCPFGPSTGSGRTGPLRLRLDQPHQL